MNISIHATHRLPFFNATVTAKQLSSSTTPVVFKLATGEEIGYEIRTNARGFICRTDGTPYNDGVFVGEDAIVTATLGDGSSTSWTVTSESEIIIFDGILYGREAESGDDPNTLVKVGDKYYKKLFSANQRPNSQLSLDDLANVPSFTKWTDDQQIEVIDFKSPTKTYTVKIGLQTKVLILKPKDNTALESGVVFKLFLQPTLAEDGESSRFGRNVVITNSSNNRVVLYNIGDNVPFGGLDGNRSVTVTETYPNAPASSTEGGEAKFQCTESYQFVSGYQGVVVDSSDKLTITDGSTDVIDIVQIQSVSDSTKTLNVKVDTSAVNLTRRVTLRRLDPFLGTIRLTTTDGVELGFLQNAGTMELIIAKNYAKPVDEHIVRNGTASITLSESAGQYPEIPMGCTRVYVDCIDNTSQTELHKILVSPQSTDAVRMEFSNASVPIWVAVVNSEEPDFIAEQFCIPAGTSRVCIQLVCGAARLLERSWVDWVDMSREGGDWEAIATTLDVHLDIGVINSATNSVFGYTHDGPTNHLKIVVPVAPGATAHVRMDCENYTATDIYEDKNPHLHLYGSNGKRCARDIEDGKVLTGWYDWQDEQNNILLSSQLVTFTLTSSDSDQDNAVSQRTILQRPFR